MSKWIKHKILKKTYIRIKPCWMNIMKRKRVFNLSSIGLVLLLPYVLVGMVNGSERILMNYRLDMEMYLAAILSCQISSGYELQTIEAQAVIARSNLTRKLEEKENITEFLRETGMGIKSQWKWWIENEIYEINYLESRM